MIEIEKGIPIPKYGTKPRKYPLLQMEVGDSFFVEGKKSGAQLSALLIREKPKKFTTRKVDGGVRVWRIA